MNKKVTRYFLIHLSFFILMKLAYTINGQYARSREEDWKKEIWELENL